jgi:hypothetical protein
VALAAPAQAPLVEPVSDLGGLLDSASVIQGAESDTSDSEHVRGFGDVDDPVAERKSYLKMTQSAKVALYQTYLGMCRAEIQKERESNRSSSVIRDESEFKSSTIRPPQFDVVRTPTCDEPMSDSTDLDEMSGNLLGRPWMRITPTNVDPYWKCPEPENLSRTHWELSRVG